MALVYFMYAGECRKIRNEEQIVEELYGISVVRADRI